MGGREGKEGEERRRERVKREREGGEGGWRGVRVSGEENEEVEIKSMAKEILKREKEGRNKRKKDCETITKPSSLPSNSTRT